MVKKMVLPQVEVEEMLACLLQVADFTAWRNIIWALSNEYGPEKAQEVLGQRGILPFPFRDDTFKRLCHKPNRLVTSNHLIYLAGQHGYHLPDDEYEKLHRQRRRRKPGQVALEDIFAGGVNLVTIGNDLYKYNESLGFYGKLSDESLLKQIAEYFNRYTTNKDGDTAFATSKHHQEALTYVKTTTFVDPAFVNPPGINVANGYLRMNYDDNSNPFTELLPHTADNVFTYRSEVSYDPNADPSMCDKMVSDILPLPDHQEIFFRTIGASLDLLRVRQCQGRAIKALFLLGEGNNGKDTLRECLAQIYGGHGVTSIPLQAFKNADRERSFGLHSLVYSRINWSSENDKLSIDTCQTLKNVISGDEITIEEKYKPSFALRPRTVPIFNLNETPAIESVQEAISSRYTLLPFNSVFKMNPDPSRPWEKKADPRFKDDPVYLRQAVLSAFLNRVIQGFYDVLQNGIDYSAVDALMQEVREENSHILCFVRDSRLVECSHEQGMQTSEVYALYEQWCIEQSLIKVGTYHNTYNDPNKYDPIVKDPRQFTKRLKRFFPHLEPKRVTSGSILPLRVAALDEQNSGVYGCELSGVESEAVDAFTSYLLADL